jgi:hypothetical protein
LTHADHASIIHNELHFTFSASYQGFATIRIFSVTARLLPAASTTVTGPRTSETVPAAIAGVADTAAHKNKAKGIVTNKANATDDNFVFFLTARLIFILTLNA